VQRSEARPRAVKTALALAIVVLTAAGMTVPAHAQTYRVLYEFTGGTDGAYPFAGLIRDPLGNLVRGKRGNLYGTASGGGGFGAGTVFMLDRRGRQTVLHTFTGGADGGYPFAELLPDEGGSLYGTALGGGGFGAGTVFKLTPE